ncbi:MAG: rRNA maturation RNase YbeY [Candidatus Liptonbacteria bacterium]|nr:rRNA maturation RNase YbeY [Candidatus Liptonbacteria bacterium]
MASAAVLVVSGSAKERPYERGIRRALTVGLRTLRVRGSLEVYLVDDRTMRSLNKRYRGKDKPANVLSFPWPQQFIAFHFASRPLGEIYLGLDIIRRHGEDPLFLAVHGLLHLLGYDHVRAKDRKRMEAAERRIMRRVS